MPVTFLKATKMEFLGDKAVLMMKIPITPVCYTDTILTRTSLICSLKIIGEASGEKRDITKLPLVI